MLNRRLIRIRAMQALYSYEKSRGANVQLALDLIAESFAPDLNSMEKQDKPKLLGKQKLAQSLFLDEVNDKTPEDEVVPPEIKTVLSKAREFYRNKNKKDFDNVSLQSQIDAEKVYEQYLMLLQLLVELSAKFPEDSNFHKNKAIKVLAASKELEYQCLRKSVNWESERANVNKIYNEALKKNLHVREYEEKINRTFEEELAIVKYVIKNVLLKHEVCHEIFEKTNLYWEEDREILRTMLFHTFNDFVELSTVNIEVLDDVWEESKSFLKVLFTKSVHEEKELMSYLVPFLRNWDFERIVETDRILLKMAAAELIHFPSIPVKVTINEIIEIAKNFSSQKSGQFVNGVLDSLIKDLTSKDIIKKTGRGMIDNK
jgi:transcription antitermination protein NusB